MHAGAHTVFGFAATLALLLLVGCESYRLGHPAELPFETIYVRPAANDSYAPQAQALISSEVRASIIRDGRVRLLAKEDEADALLTITLSEYKRAPAARRKDDTERAVEHDVSLTATISLYDTRSQAYLLKDRSLNERDNISANNPFTLSIASAAQSLQQSEYQTMPKIARNLARKIVDEALGGW